MGVVQGLTKARMLAIEAASVIGGTISGNNLILTKFDGSTVNAGNVRGPAGPAGAPFAVVEIGNAINLNTIVASGYYVQTQTSEAVSGSNYPVPLAGMLEVVVNANSTMIWQRYTVYNTSTSNAADTYVRSCYNGTWNNWVRLSPAIDTGWVDITINSLFSGLGSGTPATQRPQARKIGSLVYTRGGITGTVTANAVISNVMTVTADFAPAASASSQIYAAGASTGEATAKFFVNSSGTIDLRVGATVGAYYTLSGASWFTD